MFDTYITAGETLFKISFLNIEIFHIFKILSKLQIVLKNGFRIFKMSRGELLRARRER